MTREEAEEKLHALNTAITVAQSLIRNEKATLDQFFAEKARMESVGPILDPTLFNNSERAAAEAALTPVYEAARVFLRDYDRAVATAQAALKAVRSGDPAA